MRYEKLNEINWKYLKKINSLVLEYTSADAELEVEIFFKHDLRNSKKVELIENNGRIPEFSGGATALAIIKAGNILRDFHVFPIRNKNNLLQQKLPCWNELNFNSISTLKFKNLFV